jgi:hypothetical protein
MRSLMLTALLTVLLTVCTPTEPCACSPATTAAVVVGRVTAAGGAPAAGVRVEAEVYDRACGETPAYPTNVGQRGAVTDVEGHYRVQVRSLLGAPQVACAAAAAIVGADTIRGPQAGVGLRRGPPLDSARVDIVLP